MDAIGSAAALAQLLSQAISLWQEIVEVREAVRSAPTVIKTTKTQLSTLLETVQEIQRQPELNTHIINAQLDVIWAAALDLAHMLKAMSRRQTKSKIYQGVYAFGMRQRDDAKLDDVLQRLAAAKAELLIRINVIHVSVSRDIGESVEMLGHEVRKATWDKDTRTVRQHHVVIEGNMSGDDAKQINAITGVESAMTSTTASIQENRALGTSRQRNFISLSPSLLKMVD